MQHSSTGILVPVIHTYSSFMQRYPLGSPLFCGKRVKYRFIEFSVLDYGPLPYLLSLFF